MSIGLVVTQGYGNGTLVGDINLVVTRGYIAGEPLPDVQVTKGGIDLREEAFFRRKQQRFQRALQEELERQLEEPKKRKRRKKRVEVQTDEIRIEPLLAPGIGEFAPIPDVVRAFRQSMPGASTARIRAKAQAEFERRAREIVIEMAIADEEDAIMVLLLSI